MTTNQAFIKAYRHDPAELVPARPASAAIGIRAQGAALGTMVQYISAVGAESTSTYKDRDVLTPSEVHRPGAADWPTCDAPFGRIDTLQREAGIGKRPLSAFTSQAPRRYASSVRSIAEPAARQESAARFEPGTTIASFSWPSVCRSLCQQCGPELDRIADLLIRHATEARSLIGVICIFPKLGVTTTTLCIANRIAARRRRVVIVEGNFLAPRLAVWLDAKPTVWWQDVLESAGPAADAVIRAVDENIDLLPLDATTKSPLDVAGCLQVGATSGVLRAAYDVVLVDLGPFFDPDAQPIALELVHTMQLDAALAVAGPEGADPRDVATIAEYLGQRGCHLLGTIENRTAITPTTVSTPSRRLLDL